MIKKGTQVKIITGKDKGKTGEILEINRRLNKIKIKFPKIIKEIRGKGLILGIQLYHDQTKFIENLMKNKLLTIRAAENVIRVLPPLNVKKKEIDMAIEIINKVCSEYKN